VRPEWLMGSHTHSWRSPFPGGSGVWSVKLLWPLTCSSHDSEIGWKSMEWMHLAQDRY
jgi:hypothetical protein